MATTCQRCGNRPATVHVTELAAAGGHAEAHLCSACCQEAGWVPVLPPPAVTALVAPAPAPAAVTGGEAVGELGPCPTCGLAFADYQQVNLLGCANDWIRFAEPLRELVHRWHGSERHVGRRPGDVAPTAAATRRAALTAELTAAVAGERYEEAARLRDLLRHLDGPA
jgi:protein arginine kinase activator